MKSRRIRLVENSVERTARMLAHKYGIRVVWRGTQAKTDGKTITLPVLPDDAPDELLEAVQGFLDHETAHIIFTDFEVYDGDRTQAQFDCINVVEDVRIEACMGKLFPGTPHNLRKVHDWISLKLSKNWENISTFNRALSAYFMYAKYGEEEPFYRAVVDADTKELVKKCVEAVGAYTNIVSTADAVVAGLRMYEVLKSEAEEARKEESKDDEITLTDANGNPVPITLHDLGALLSHEAGKLLVGVTSYQHGQETSGYLVYSTDEDTVESIEDSNTHTNAVHLHSLREDARSITHCVRTRLVNALRSTMRRRWLGGRESGRVDTRRLHHAILGTSENVYKTQTDRVQLDTAVALAIDHSGSMTGRKLELAGEAAIVLGDVLHTLRVPFTVYGYSTENKVSNLPTDLSPYARWCGLWIRSYRKFTESWDKGAVRLAGAKYHTKASTLDAESIQYGIRELLARPEKRKILLVFNDGMPHPGLGHVGRCQQRLRDVVASAKANGVEVVAFGIQSEHVKEYYPNHVVIHKLDDLIAEPLLTLDRLLRGGVSAK